MKAYSPFSCERLSVHLPAMSKPFVSLHTHSYYSILGSAASPASLLEKAKKLGCPALALTDSGVGYGLIDFYEASQKIEGIKPILGCEVYVASDSRFERRAGIDGREGHLVLLAQNQKGWENLLQIVSLAHLEGFYYKPRADWELLEQYSEGLVVLSGSTGGLLGRLLRDGMKEKSDELLDRLTKIYGEKNVYLELVARHFPEQKELNEWVVELAEKNKFSVVLTSDARYLEAEDEEACDTLTCIAKSQLVSEPSRFRFAEKNWFKSFEEMAADLSYVPEEILEQARKNTLQIAEEVDLELEFNKSLLPAIELEEGKTVPDQLRSHCEKGIKKLFPKATPKELKPVHERLDYELSVIGNMGFEAYFLIVEDFIKFAKDNGIAVGPGRGSAAGSLVSYLLNITTIDPLKYELLFERFLNPERISMPDIDIDFSDERRDEVLQYVTEKYGAERVSKVCTFGTLAAKAALKDVGRAFGVPFAEMNMMTKVLPNKPGFSLDEAEEVPDFMTLIKTKSHLKKVFSVAKKLEGCVRHVSVHACAVMIAPDDLRRHAPVQWAPGAEEVKITQFPYQQLEHLGLLKMDFLGLKNLSVLEKAVLHIKATCGVEIDLPNIPIDDAKTFEMMANGETTGVFQFESAGMRRYLRELKPTDIEDLVAMNALYRPGPMEYIPQYINGKHDPSTVKYMHEALEPILKKTYGIAVYQEQVLKIAQVFAGFSLGEADLLRKAIGKKIASILAEQRKRFIDGAVEKGHKKAMAEKIFDEIIVPFSGYGFNRSHAVCYARVAYETAYLRANYPVEFMAAMMTADRNNTDRIVLEMNECGAMGIEVLPPSINESGSHFTVIQPQKDADQLSLPNKKEEEKETTADGKKIRFGLSAIKGMGEDTVDQIMFERKKNGLFKSLSDFAKRVPAKLVNKKTLEALSFSGAFDEFGDRKAIVDSLDDLSKYAKEHQEKEEAGQMGLFGGVDEEAIEFVLKEGKATKEDILAWERESMGLFVSDHPLKGLDGYFKKYGTLIGHLNPGEDVGQKKTFHGIVAGARKIITKTGKQMGIIQLEDTSGKIEVAVFPFVFDKVPLNAFNQDAFIRLRGKVDERDGNLNVIADEIDMGNLKAIQAKVDAGLVFKNDDEEEVVSNGNVESSDDQFVIRIKVGAKKAVVDKLKKILAAKKVDQGKEVVVILGENKVKLPFEVEYSEALVEEVEKVLG